MPGSTIRVKRIYLPAEREDGLRILVDRLWPRGVKKERARVDLWMKDIAPSHTLRTWYGHDPARWMAFRERYLAELQQPDRQTSVQKLLTLARQQPITLLFAARDEQRNHAVVLKEYLDSRAEPTPAPE